MKKNISLIPLVGMLCLSACGIYDTGIIPETKNIITTESGPDESASEAPETTSQVTADAGTDFETTLDVYDSDSFYLYLKEARDRLVPVVTMTIHDYSDEVFDIRRFKKGKYSISAQGQQRGSVAYMTYAFTYGESYMITRAIEAPELRYRLNEKQLETIDRLSEIAAQTVTDDTSEYQKELALHDYIVKNYQYDSEAAAAENIPEYATNISDFLDTKKGVCEAYAYTFKALCNLSGLECVVVSGDLDGRGHAWNIVSIGGKYYNVDVTSDDPVPDQPDHVFYSYFNVTDDAISKTHSPKNTKYVCDDTAYNYFVYNDLIVTDADSFKAFVLERLNEGKTSFIFKCEGYRLNDIDINEALKNKGFTSYTILGTTSDPYGDFELTLNR